jgi:hypothetical protein
VGDVFEVSLGASLVGFFQYVARDSSQLHSHVVRVFKGRFAQGEIQDVSDVVRGDIDFHAHVFLSLGAKRNFWRKVGRAGVEGSVDVIFRNSSDYGRSTHKTSDKWFVWRIDGPFTQIGALSGPYRNAEIGIVVPPESLAYRMNHGVYDFYYPEPG